MVSLIPEFDVEFFNSAYENICLIANKTWAFDKDDPYRKLNEHLWIQNFKYFEKLQGKCPRSNNVYNVILGSSTTQYDNHQHNVKRESLCSQNNHRTSAQDNGRNSYVDKPTTEPWMLDEVEKCFTQLTSNLQLTEESHCSILNDDSSEFIGRDIDYNKYCPLPYKIDNVAELQLQIRISHENIRHIWNSNEINQPTSLSSSSSLSSSLSSLSSSASLKNEKCEYHYTHCQQNDSNPNEKSNVSNYNEDICRLQHQPVIIAKTRYKARVSKGQKKSTTVPILSAEVPEFFPKCPGIIHDSNYDTVSQQQFLFPIEKNNHEKIIHFNRPQLSNVHAVYQSPNLPLIATPIMTPLMRPSYHHWIPHIPPPPPIPIPIGSLAPYSSMSLQSICPVIHRPIQLHEKFMIHPGQMNNTAGPIPVYQRPPELYQDQKQRKKSQGVDFNNLILLTKNAMKARRNQSKNPQQSSSFILESRQPNLKSETDVLQWLNKGYAKRAKEFSTINSLVSDLRDFENMCAINSDETLKNPDLLQSIFEKRSNYCDKSNDSDTGNYDLSIKHI